MTGLFAIALVVLLLFLAVATVLGHGLWLLLARLFAGPAPVQPPKTAAAEHVPRRCPDCRKLMPAGASRCPNCATHEAASVTPPTSAAVGPLAVEDEWDITARQVGKLFQLGKIDSAVFLSLDAAIQTVRAPAERTPLPVAAPAIDPEPAIPFASVAARVSTPPPQPKRIVKSAPRRPLSEVLASFMERKNIRWGELVGGLLIVGCSIALVLSFWAQIQQHPLMKFSIFTAVTAGLFSLGLYSEHRWKLATTSRGILVTATLLIPLNFLAFAAFSHGLAGSDPVALGGEVIAFVLFLVLAWFAARVVVPQWPAWLAAGVMALSAGTLAVRYLSVNAGDAELPVTRLLGLSGIVVCCYAASCGGVLLKVRRSGSLDSAGANAALLSLAILSFAAALPLMFIGTRGADGSLHRLAPLIALAGLPGLAGGVLLARRLGEPALKKLRIAATVVSVVGAAVVVGGIPLAWPNPGEMLANSIIAFAAFIALALFEGSCFWFFAAQAAGYCAAMAAVVLCLGPGDGTLDRTCQTLADVATWRAIGLAWAALSLAWAGLRRAAQPAGASASSADLGALGARAARPWGTNAAALAQIRYTLDRGMSLLLLAVLASLALFTTASSVLMELGPAGRGNDAPGPRIVLAIAGPLPWLVLLTLLAAYVVDAWGTIRGELTWPVLVISWLACPLLAADDSHGMAGGMSAIRWAVAAWMSVAAIAIWWRRGSPGGKTGARQPTDALLLLLGVFPIVALALFEVATILFASGGPAGTNAFHALLPGISYIVPLLAVMAFLLVQGRRHRSISYSEGSAIPGAGCHGQAYPLARGAACGSPAARARDYPCPCHPGKSAATYAAAALAVSWLAGPLWAAGHSHAMTGDVSPFRWVTAAWLLLAAGIVWWRRGFIGSRGRASAGQKAHLDAIDALLLVLGVFPIVAGALYQIGSILNGDSPNPGPGMFPALGPVLNDLVPLLAVTAFLVGQALRHRLDRYAVAGIGSLNVVVTSAYALVAGGALDSPSVLRLLQLNIATAAAAALAWLVLWVMFVRRREVGWAASESTRQAPPKVLEALSVIALAANVLLIVPAAGELFLQPQVAPSLGAATGGIWGWLALGLSAALATTLAILQRRSLLQMGGTSLTLIAALLALAASAWDRGNWLSFHVWMGAQTAAPWLIIGLGWWLERRGWLLETSGHALEPGKMPPADAAPADGHSKLQVAEPATGPGGAAMLLDYHVPEPRAARAGPAVVRQSTMRWAGMLGLLAVILALRSGLGDPAAPWPSASVLVFIGLLAAALAVWKPAPAALYAASGLINIAATLVYAVSGGRWGNVSALGLAEVNVAALALPAIAWLVLELEVFRRFRQPGRSLAVHQFAALITVIVLAAFTAIGLAQPTLGFSMAAEPLLEVVTFGSVAGLLVACLWDETRRLALPLLYFLGLIICARYLECAGLSGERFFCAAAVTLAGYGLLTSVVSAFGGILRPLAVRIGLPQRGFSESAWLLPANVTVAATVLCLAFWADFGLQSVSLRLLPAIAALTQTASLALLSRSRGRTGGSGVIQSKPEPGRFAGAGAIPVAVAIGVAALLALAWAWVDPAADPGGLQHAALAAALLTAVAVPASLARPGKPARRHAWADAFRVDAPILGVGCVASLAVGFGLELLSQVTSHRVDMPGWSIAAMASALAAGCVSAIVLALRSPAVDSVTAGLEARSGRRQRACVYGAEVLLAMLLAHVRLTLPFLFHGYLERYWPLVVMAIAFAGVAAGEAFRRRGRLTFADPLQNTGAFLPLIPVLAFWACSFEVHYSVLLLLAAALYGLLAFLRKSTILGLLGALAGNGALWYLLNGSEGLGFFAHPQVWVIPAALSGLIALEINGSRLDAAQLRAGRYCLVVALYLSSTADLFINATAHSTWLPVILAALSVAGVLAGIALRVRPFLFLGTAFLSLSIVAMIYNAAASLHITWIWYVAGILLGSLIIVLFALFEKKRATMLALVDGLKAWQ
jgi:hypothetical protein